MYKENIRVSIIMPVYNVQKYLRQCLNSLLSQTLEGIEIIAVNDGSTDGSLAIIEEFQKDNADILRVYSTENHGVSHARNYGMERAVGEYVLFVDSDDFIEHDMCEKLYMKAIKDNNDIVVCGRYNVFENNLTGQLRREYIKPEMINKNFNLHESKYELAHILPFPWDKLFKRELLEGMKFPENMRFEDLVFAYEVVVKANSIGVIYDPLYNYRKTTEGGFLNTFSRHTLDIIKAFELLFDYMEQNNYMDYYYDELEYICARHFLFRYITLFKNENRGKGKLDIKLEIINRTQDFLDSRLPDWRNNHYLNYSSDWLRKRLPLFKNRKKMLRITKLRERTPNKVYNVVKHFRDFFIRGYNFLKKFRKSKSKFNMLKKKLPFLSVLFQKGSVYYTHLYETLQVEPRTILLESKHGEDVAGNIFAFLKELSKSQYDKYNVLLAIEAKSRQKYRGLLSSYGIENVTMIDIFSKDYDKALVTSKYLITDTSFPPYFIKRKDQVYLNTWHGTPLKAMGRIVPQREYALGNIQRNFLIADYLLYQNDFSRDVFMKDYMIKDIYPGKALLSGYPRNSVFFDKQGRELVRRDCNISDKQVIVYMPTWRGLLHNKETDKQLKLLNRYFTELDEGLKDSQVFYVKLHPYVKDKMDFSGYRHIKEFPKKYESYDFLNASDVLVTDYSSIMFDYAVTKNKIILFAYDAKEYLDGRGLYLDLDDLGLPIVGTVNELIDEIGKVSPEYTEFYERFCAYDSADTPARVLDILLNGQAETTEHINTHAVSNKRRVFIFIKGFKKDLESQKRLEMINSIDTDIYDVYVCMKVDDVKESTGMLSQLKNEINYFPILFDINYTRADYFACKIKSKLMNYGMGFGKRADRIMEREKRKYFADVSFDYVIHQSCQDPMVGHLCLQLEGEAIYNFTYFRQGMLKKRGSFSRVIRYFMKLFPRYDWVVVGKGDKKRELEKDNTIVMDDIIFSVSAVLKHINQQDHEAKENSQLDRETIYNSQLDKDKQEGLGD